MKISAMLIYNILQFQTQSGIVLFDFVDRYSLKKISRVPPVFFSAAINLCNAFPKAYYVQSFRFFKRAENASHCLYTVNWLIDL